ncbi:DUF4357 domain-containing protein [Microbacterium sp. 20-116]|uniref:DUF4357 domain-containing protein n=1 Tax=Microbacterium sp. 20-116 TaxID=3239883 RepID=UPI0034E27E97
MQDVVFSSPSAAAAVIAGRSANGRTSWIDTITGRTSANGKAEASPKKPTRGRSRSGNSVETLEKQH